MSQRPDLTNNGICLPINIPAFSAVKIHSKAYLKRTLNLLMDETYRKDSTAVQPPRISILVSTSACADCADLFIAGAAFRAARVLRLRRSNLPLELNFAICLVFPIALFTPAH